MKNIKDYVLDKLSCVKEADEDFYEQEYRYFAIFLTAFFFAVAACLFQRQFMMVLYIFIFFLMFLLFEYHRFKTAKTSYNIKTRCVSREKPESKKEFAKKAGRHTCVLESLDTPGLFFEILIPKKSSIAPGNEVKMIFSKKECRETAQDTIFVDTLLLLKIIKKNGSASFPTKN